MMITMVSSKQQGLSLIELMVAMALSVILMAGVVQVFIGNKKSFDITRDLSDVQENGRMGLTFIGESIRMADHWGSLEGSQVNDSGPSVNDVGGSCVSAWIIDSETAIEGFEGGLNAPVDCIDEQATNYVDNTDVIVVRYADSRTSLTDADLASVDNDDVIVRLTTAEKGVVFEGANSASAISSIPLGTSVVNYPYMIELYYVRNCSIKAADGKCDANIDSTPTLVRMTLNGNSFQEQALVEGIEQLQFEYGLDTDGDLVADTYASEGDAILDSDDEWNTVVSVRMSLVSRASKSDSQVNDTRTYPLVGGYDHVADADVREFRRKQFNREVHLRNRSRL